LDLAEAEAGALHLNRESLNLSALVLQQIDLYQPALAAHNHTLEIEVADGVFVNGDVSLIHRVMSNLFDNELSHLPNGCHVQIRLYAQDHQAQLVVEDDGPGFPVDLRNHVFDRFVKGKHSQGRGLGLAFVNAVVQAHGGTVKISDAPRGGAAITVSLPVQAG
jgi:signal transduction histidine kinase